MGLGYYRSIHTGLPVVGNYSRRALAGKHYCSSSSLVGEGPPKWKQKKYVVSRRKKTINVELGKNGGERNRYSLQIYAPGACGAPTSGGRPCLAGGGWRFHAVGPLRGLDGTGAPGAPPPVGGVASCQLTRIDCHPPAPRQRFRSVPPRSHMIGGVHRFSPRPHRAPCRVPCAAPRVDGGGRPGHYWTAARTRICSRQHDACPLPRAGPSNYCTTQHRACTQSPLNLVFF